MDIPIFWDSVNDDVKEFSFIGETKEAKVVNVYDGDTIKVVFSVLGKLYKFNSRIQHVDTPEIRTRNKKHLIKPTNRKWVLDLSSELLHGQESTL